MSDTAPLIVGVGDSITWGSSTSDPPSTSYVNRAAALLGARALNLGVPGIFTEHIALDAIPADASIVVVNVGTNDVGVASGRASADEAIAKLAGARAAAETLFARVRERAPHARLAVVTIRDLGRARALYPDVDAAVITAASRAWNAAVRDLAARYDATVIDLEHDAAWYEDGHYDATGVHPTDIGADRLARTLAERLSTAASHRS